ncbi:glutamate racemase [Hazenella coriacea]|uniref:Glutamate racemase n=1 Tax=Hazenella coriacea TaxID=1179467 RepID=A0A4R3LBG8_9BACL|nr:glutamate racemase [Hazenella coriacea]TCS96560.1 glutamate racemase [Hazenella coriacea]
MDIKKEHAIGILDSGVGGLTVAKEVMRQLPQEAIIYLGDTKRCPYGPRTKEEVKKFTLEIVHFLSQFPLKALVIACNTATAAALHEVRLQIPIPVLGVIKPGVRAAIKATKQHRIGVIGTQGTIQSQAYEQALKRIHPEIEVYSVACPQFAPLVENGLHQSELAEKVVAEGLAPFQNISIDTLILGCTHYPLLAESIAKVMGEKVEIISSAEETAAELSTILQHQSLLAYDYTPDHHFFTTGDPHSFKKIAETWLGQTIKIEQARLEPVQKISF